LNSIAECFDKHFKISKLLFSKKYKIKVEKQNKLKHVEMCWLNILDRFNFRWFIFVNNTIQFQINIWEITNQSSIDVISTEIFYLQFNWCLFKKNIQRSLKISLQPVWKVKLIVEFDATQKIYFFLVRNAVFLLLRISFVFLFYHFETSLWCLLELWVEKSQSVMQFCAKKNCLRRFDL
jgi:hypothetical protein